MTSSKKTTLSAVDYYRAAHHSALVDFLPDLRFDDTLLEELSFLPPVPDDEIRAQPAHERLKYISELKRIHVALHRDLDLAESVHRMIVDGYNARGTVAAQRAASSQRSDDLANAEHNAYRAKLDYYLTLARDADDSAETKALIGFPGMGKTRTLKQLRRRYYRAIRVPASKDPRLPAIIIPLLHVECPADRTIPSLHTLVLKAIEEAIGEKLPKSLARGNRTQRILIIADILQHYHVGLLVIDEIQKLVKATGKPDYIILNFILEIANTLKVPVLFVGTPASQRLLGEEFRNARRLLGRPWTTFSAESSEWKRVVKTIWEYQFTSEFTPLDEQVLETLHEETQGILSLLIRLLVESQRVLIMAKQRTRATGTGISEKLTPEILKSTAATIFKNVRHMLAALRSGSIESLERYEDLSFDDGIIERRTHELAEYRRHEFLRTVRCIRREGTNQRRTAKAALRLEVGALLDGHSTATNAASHMRSGSDSVKPPKIR